MRYLLSVAIGPVQDFISAARRCRDLWYGSKLLSDVSKAAAKSLVADGAMLIFPAPKNAADLDDDEFTAANKILALVETEAIESVTDRAHAAAKARLVEAGRFDRRRLRGTKIEWNRFNSQLEGILEFYAAWAPHQGDHAKTRARVERLAGGRKALRNFPRYDGVPGVPKSSLDGVRENVVLERSDQLYESNLKEKEWLDAIGVVKRFAEYAPFDSTIDVAAVPYVRGRKEHRRRAMEQYEEMVQKEELPPETYSLLYRHESRQIFEDRVVDQQKLEEIRKLLGDPAPPYYAFLVGDGDRMGKAIGSIPDAGGHRAFSLKLSEFATEARRLIKSDAYRGCAIYCGGDDVIALLPLDNALECARAVNRQFVTSMAGYDVSFSAGLVVAHALEPLSDVREWAHQAEKAAKDPSRGNRNALCVAVWPRSGAPVEVFGQWEELGKLLEDLTRLYLKKELSLGLAHEFRELVERTRGWSEIHDVIPKMAVAIAQKKDRSEGAVNLVRDNVTDWKSLERLCHAMLAARPFARAKREAAWDGGAN